MLPHKYAPITYDPARTRRSLGNGIGLGSVAVEEVGAQGGSGSRSRGKMPGSLKAYHKNKLVSSPPHPPTQEQLTVINILLIVRRQR